MVLRLLDIMKKLQGRRIVSKSTVFQILLMSRYKEPEVEFFPKDNFLASYILRQSL